MKKGKKIYRPLKFIERNKKFAEIKNIIIAYFSKIYKQRQKRVYCNTRLKLIDKYGWLCDVIIYQDVNAKE